MNVSAFDFIFDGLLILVCSIWLVFFAKTVLWLSPPPTKVIYPVKDMVAQVGLIVGLINMVIDIIGVWLYGYSQ